MIKVLIVDDHELLRIGIKKLLSELDDIEIVGEARSGEEALTLAREMHPDVVLMDVKMPGIGGLEAARRILQLRQDPEIKVIALTSCKEEPFPSRFIQAGAQGYLTKGCDLDEMILAIRKVNNNERYISPEIAQDLALSKLSSNKKETPFDKLSERELQVMLMITNGQKVQDISDKLCLSPKTVNSYRYRLFEKLNLNNDVELTHLAIRHGMLGEEIYPEDEAPDTE